MVLEPHERFFLPNGTADAAAAAAMERREDFNVEELERFQSELERTLGVRSDGGASADHQQLFRGGGKDGREAVEDFLRATNVEQQQAEED